jgi:hypothetical protein
VDAFRDDQSPDPAIAARIEALAGFGLTSAEIAHVLGMSESALLACYSGLIESGRIKTNARVAESLFRKATGDGQGAVAAAIFWLKTRARWKETSVEELAPAADAVITVRIGGSTPEL